jgi:hypothetical protein
MQPICDLPGALACPQKTPTLDPDFAIVACSTHIVIVLLPADSSQLLAHQHEHAAQVAVSQLHIPCDQTGTLRPLHTHPSNSAACRHPSCTPKPPQKDRNMATTLKTKSKSHNTTRRPAMIPADALPDLTSEDKAAIRLRTGRYPVIFHPAAAAKAAALNAWSDFQEKTGDVTVREVGEEGGDRQRERDREREELMRKRKASTTSEMYRERCGEGKENQWQYQYEGEKGGKREGG